MSVDAREEQYEHVELFGKPALFTDSSIDWSTMLTSEPITIPKEGSRRLHGKLNFLGECPTLPEFCEEHGIALPSDNRKCVLRPASPPNEAGIFYALPKKQDAALGGM